MRRGIFACLVSTMARSMKPGDCCDIGTEVLSDTDAPLLDPLDRVDQQYVIEAIQRALPFKTEVRVWLGCPKVTFTRLTS